ncbi:MAG: hypothetical protein ACLP19_08970, partial [Xanthobacteraceae bacterium]
EHDAERWKALFRKVMLRKKLGATVIRCEPLRSSFLRPATILRRVSNWRSFRAHRRLSWYQRVFATPALSGIVFLLSIPLAFVPGFSESLDGRVVAVPATGGRLGFWPLFPRIRIIRDRRCCEEDDHSPDQSLPRRS